MDEPDVQDVVTISERGFAFGDLLGINYFQTYRRGYYASRLKGVLSPHRNYVRLLKCLEDIKEYNEQHASSFAKRLRENANNWSNAEAVFAEIIVYRHYVRQAYEGLIKRVELNSAESDVIVERLDGTRAYLEVFCVMPNFPISENGKPIVSEVKTHTQKAMGSIRQKLLQKISVQRQLSKPRENYAVIELNNPVIAGEFSVLSSLSSGLTARLDSESMEIKSVYYDWKKSIFEDESTKFLKAVIYFDLGDYDSRKFVFNPRFQSPTAANHVESTDGANVHRA